MLPVMNGRALAELLTSARPEMRVIFMSGYTDDAIAHHGIIDSGVNFLEKPVLANTLLARVRSVLDG
jgi:FixJ family two-component response regulator